MEHGGQSQQDLILATGKMKIQFGEHLSDMMARQTKNVRRCFLRCWYETKMSFLDWIFFFDENVVGMITGRGLHTGWTREELSRVSPKPYSHQRKVRVEVRCSIEDEYHTF